jgi:heme-degrading monooxygenase HmoA
MHYILFRGHLSATPSSTSTWQKYYNTASNMPGFLSHSTWHEPSNPNIHVLFATFADENAVKEWRNNTLRLSMMHSARHEVFRDFSITIGIDEPREGHVVLIYRRPAGKENVRKDEERVEKLTTGPERFEGEGEVMWVWPLMEDVDVEEIVEGLERVGHDELVRMYVLRSYSKEERAEAPRGLDRAEEEAVQAGVL